LGTEFKKNSQLLPERVAVAERMPSVTTGAVGTFAAGMEPVTEKPVELLINKALPPLESAIKDGTKKLRTKTIRHIDCKEVGHDNFDNVVSEVLGKIGEENIMSITTISYSYIEMGTQKLLVDFGVMIIYRG
jgi:hypothetical protein